MTTASACGIGNIITHANIIHAQRTLPCKYLNHMPFRIEITKEARKKEYEMIIFSLNKGMSWLTNLGMVWLCHAPGVRCHAHLVAPPHLGGVRCTWASNSTTYFFTPLLPLCVSQGDASYLTPAPPTVIMHVNKTPFPSKTSDFTNILYLAIKIYCSSSLTNDRERDHRNGPQRKCLAFLIVCLKAVKSGQHLNT